MGKLMTVYLTEDELKQVKQFCENQGVVPHRAVKVAIREFFFNIDAEPSSKEENSNMEKPTEDQPEEEPRESRSPIFPDELSRATEQRAS